MGSFTTWLCSIIGGAFLLLLLYALIVRVVFAARNILRRRRYANRFGVEELARRLDMSVEVLLAVEPAYAVRHIPKKRGGTRVLLVPDPELKRIQRLINRRLLARLRVHPAATGFQPGLSIVHNAAMHVGQAVVLRMDIVDFFSDTDAERIRGYFRRIGWDAVAADLLVKLTTADGGLPQGAPTSPRLSNLVNYVMDCQIDEKVRRWKGTYTRYADDITISFPKDYPKKVRSIIRDVKACARSHGYEIHRRGKLRILRRHQQQRVCGLVVNEKVQIPREKRRWLRTVKHRLRTTGQASLTPEQFVGWRAYQAMIDRQRGDTSGATHH